MFHSQRRRVGCGLLGCLTLLILLVVLACVGLFALLTGRAHAAPAARHTALVVDQSSSIVSSAATETLARDVVMTTLVQLRSQAMPDDTVEMVFFGLQATPIISTTSLQDDRLMSRIQQAFTKPRSMGGTAIAAALSDLMRDNDPPTDVVLVTDGIPDRDGVPTNDRQAVYAGELREVAAQYAQRGIHLAILLIGNTSRGDWLPVWQAVTDLVQGDLVEVVSSDQITSAVASLRLFAPTATPRSTSVPSIVPTPTPKPTATATLTVSRSLAIVVTPLATPLSTLGTTPQEFPWLLVAIGIGSVVAFAGAIWILVKLYSRPRRPLAMPFPGDEGILEICDPKSGELQRIELQGMVPGEVRGIGNSPQCQIRLGPLVGEDELAALVMTPDGPQIESRGAPLWYEGRPVQQHALFDGDDVYLGQFILTYQNFFRQRRPIEPEEDLTII